MIGKVEPFHVKEQAFQMNFSRGAGWDVEDLRVSHIADVRLP